MTGEGAGVSDPPLGPKPDERRGANAKLRSAGANRPLSAISLVRRGGTPCEEEEG
jgi:hypothetical protein